MRLCDQKDRRQICAKTMTKRNNDMKKLPGTRKAFGVKYYQIEEASKQDPPEWEAIEEVGEVIEEVGEEVEEGQRSFRSCFCM